jgi:hypothetical protein
VGYTPDASEMHRQHAIFGLFDGYTVLFVLGAIFAMCCVLYGCYQIYNEQRVSRSATSKKRY